MDSGREAIPNDIETLKAALVAEAARAAHAEAELAVARAKAADDQALIAHQQLRIESKRCRNHTRRPYERYDKPWLSREANSVLLYPGPRQQFIEFLRGPAIDELGEDVGQISLRVNAVKFCGLDQRRDTCPVDCALVVAGE